MILGTIEKRMVQVCLYEGRLRIVVILHYSPIVDKFIYSTSQLGRVWLNGHVFVVDCWAPMCSHVDDFPPSSLVNMKLQGTCFVVWTSLGTWDDHVFFYGLSQLPDVHLLGWWFVIKINLGHTQWALCNLRLGLMGFHENRSASNLITATVNIPSALLVKEDLLCWQYPSWPGLFPTIEESAPFQISLHDPTRDHDGAILKLSNVRCIDGFVPFSREHADWGTGE